MFSNRIKRLTACIFLVVRIDASPWKSRFEVLFRGDFDNYDQVLSERSRGQSAKDVDGHEHVHCSLRWICNEGLIERLTGSNCSEAVLACYYLDGDPSGKIFRLRLYAFSGTSTMRLYRPIDIDLAHGISSDFPLKSSEELIEVCRQISWKYLQNCDIHWNTISEDFFRGSMQNGGCTLPSQYNPARLILIKDELSVSPTGLRVNDRGYDLESGKLIYGSENGIPYDLRRIQPNDSLQWTLGNSFRSREFYASKLAALNFFSEKESSPLPRND